MKRLKLKNRLLISIPVTITVTTVAFFAVFWLADLIFYKFNLLPKTEYGVTYSIIYTKELGLDLDETYRAVLEDLKVKKIRIPVYWNLVERSPGKYDFSTYDKLLDQAKEKGVKVTLAIGYKVPRWPECHPPAWLKEASSSQLQENIITYLNATVDHFKNRPEISLWQVENEPLLDFGASCKMFDISFLQQEVNLVRSKDSRPITLTESGELGFWITSLQNSDTMGSSLYRTVWNPYFGFWNYPLPPLSYSLKATILQKAFAPSSRGVYISELQAEPWSPGKSLTKVPLAEQMKIFPLAQFKDTIRFADQTGIRDHYLWGVEWWYYMKKQGYPEYWDFATTVFNQK